MVYNHYLQSVFYLTFYKSYNERSEVIDKNSNNKIYYERCDVIPILLYTGEDRIKGTTRINSVNSTNSTMCI